MTCLLTLHILFLATLLHKRIRIPHILRFPRLELYFAYWSIPAITTASAALFKREEDQSDNEHKGNGPCIHCNLCVMRVHQSRGQHYFLDSNTMHTVRKASETDRISSWGSLMRMDSHADKYCMILMNKMGILLCKACGFVQINRMQ